MIFESDGLALFHKIFHGLILCEENTGNNFRQVVLLRLGERRPAG